MFVIAEEEMEKVCGKSNEGKIVCPTANANFTIHNLPWQDKNDTDVEEYVPSKTLYYKKTKRDNMVLKNR